MKIGRASLASVVGKSKVVRSNVLRKANYCVLRSNEKPHQLPQTLLPLPDLSTCHIILVLLNPLCWGGSFLTTNFVASVIRSSSQRASAFDRLIPSHHLCIKLKHQTSTHRTAWRHARRPKRRLRPTRQLTWCCTTFVSYPAPIILFGRHKADKHDSID